jgi:hypothetical protein
MDNQFALGKLDEVQPRSAITWVRPYQVSKKTISVGNILII